MTGGAVFGIDRTRVEDAVGAVRPPGDSADLETMFARAAWSSIAEPGDAVAGALVAAVGASRALALVLAADPAAIAAELEETDVLSSARAVARWRPRLVSADVLAGLDTAARRGIRLLVPEDPTWPSRLDDLGVHSPLALWSLGRSEVVDTLDRSISIVGARAASEYGKEATMEAAAGLVTRGFAIVSGAAYGIDGVAHRAALASGGATVAFLAGGLDRFYPSGHTELIERIAAEGAVVSEVPCGTPPTRFRFLQRNRLIAAASRATIVIEAGARSGSINTAGHAASLGRPLGAVPGSIFSASSAGCHRLLREYDAVCVTSAEEMAELASGGEDLMTADGPSTATADPLLGRVLDALDRSAAPSERIAGRAGLSIVEAEGALMLLEMEGAVVETSRGWRRA